MTHEPGRRMMAAAENAELAAADERIAALANLVSPPAPTGPPAALADRAMVYLRPAKVNAVLGFVDARRSGLVMAGAHPVQTLAVLRDAGHQFPVLIDPAAYETFTATCEAPFLLPGAGGLTATLQDALDDQIAAGVTAALTPTGFIPAGATDVLYRAVTQFGQLGRADSIFVAPLDVSLVDRAFIAQTTAILAELRRPVAIVLGRQGDPLSQSRHIIPNLRRLAASVPLLAMRTDFNGLDLLAHGALGAAIGTGGQVRHTVDPAEKQRSFKWDGSPSVLWPELVSWFKGSTISGFFGARENLAPRCVCPACQGRRITRFLRPEHQDEAIGHGVAVWSPWAADLLDAATLRDRARYWQNLCAGAVRHHAMFLQLTQRLDGLALQDAVRRWSQLPAWLTDVPEPVVAVTV